MSIFNRGGGNDNMSFFEHIDTLRGHLFRSVVGLVAASVFVFFNKKFIFDTILFGPKKQEFFTYRLMAKIGKWLHMPDLAVTVPKFKVISTTLAGQFMAHMTLSFIIGLIISIPYIFWEIWRFVSPALHEKERKAATGVVGYASLLFIIGAAFGYYFIAPFSIVFLVDYSVSTEVTAMPTLDEYVDFLTSMVLMTGVAFELPMLMYFLGKIGIIGSKMLRKFRRYAVVAVLIISAIITPSVDMFSQTLVALPLYALYELSIFVVARVEKRKKIEEEEFYNS